MLTLRTGSGLGYPNPRTNMPGDGTIPLPGPARDEDMKRRWMTLAAVAGLVAAGGSANADPGGFAPPGGTLFSSPVQAVGGEVTDTNTLMGYATAPSTKAPDRYGLLPGLRNLFRVKKSGCADCDGKGGKHKDGCGPSGPVGYGPPAYPPVMQGTLAFPHNPYVRSPRDYFMYEPGR
jgi:hypothetical protein